MTVHFKCEFNCIVIKKIRQMYKYSTIESALLELFKLDFPLEQWVIETIQFHATKFSNGSVSPEAFSQWLQRSPLIHRHSYLETTDVLIAKSSPETADISKTKERKGSSG